MGTNPEPAETWRTNEFLFAKKFCRTTRTVVRGAGRDTNEGVALTVLSPRFFTLHGRKAVPPSWTETLVTRLLSKTGSSGLFPLNSGAGAQRGLSVVASNSFSWISATWATNGSREGIECDFRGKEKKTRTFNSLLANAVTFRDV